jgi:hypothetical protein
MKISKGITLLLVALGIAAALFLRQNRQAPAEDPRAEQAHAARLVELGSTSCQESDVPVDLSTGGVEEHLRGDHADAELLGRFLIPPNVDLLHGEVGSALLAQQRELFMHRLAALVAKHGVECQP